MSYSHLSFKISFILVILLVSCTSLSRQSLIGEYVSHTPFFNKTNYTIGNKLKLNSDSSFIYEGCGQIVAGKWSMINNSIVLFCFEFKYKDSLLNQYTMHQCNDSVPYECFKIIDERYLESSFRQKNRVIKNQLIKIDD